MDSNQMKPKMSAKDFFLNLGAFISLYTLVGSLLGLLFNIIDTAYPKIQNGYNYLGSSSISWPVSTLVVFFPIFVLLMVFLERQYRVEPESQNSLVHRGLTYITLFISGCVMTGDLVTVVYYFIDGRELTTGFLLKVLVLLVISTSLFIYFISDLRKKLTAKLRMLWRIFSAVVIIVSIIWGFAVLGSPRTQRLIKYDEQKVSDLQNINNQITSYYSNQGTLPYNLEEMGNGNYYVAQVDSQNQKPYEYVKNSDTTYNLCAEFNKASDDKSNTAYPKYPSYGGNITWSHPAGHYCFNETINPNIYRNSPTPMPY
ncbi:MAG TPA: DUF5671 domain-containing protein [Candidatus Paceibacterota bacterium]|nr:DUF5671 domain-containing protein [Candidatus Paceibacterota bacterium]